MKSKTDQSEKDTKMKQIGGKKKRIYIWLTWLLIWTMLVTGIPTKMTLQTKAAADTDSYRTVLAHISEAVKASAGATITNESGETTTGPFYGSVGGEWAVLGEARYGMKDASWYGNYYTNLLAQIKTEGKTINGNSASCWKLHEKKSTDNSRVILTLTAIGKDPENISGYNLVAPLADMNYVKKQGINGPIWALIALDSGNYDIPDVPAGSSGTQTTREGLISYILGKELTGGGFALTGTTADADITAMALQALAPYNQTSTRISAALTSKVQAAISRGITVLSGLQSEDGTYGASYGNSSSVSNAESTAQVVTALSALGINSAADSRFLKSGGSALSGLLTFYLSDSGMCEHTASGGANQMATEQVFYALVAYDRFQNKKNSLYDMSSEANTIQVAPQSAVLKKAVNKKTGISLTWKKISGADGYVIYRKTGNGAWKRYKTISKGTTTSYTDKKVKNGKLYAYKICAKRDGVTGKAKNKISIYRLNMPAAKAVRYKSGGIKVTWKKNGNATGYQIRYGKKSTLAGAKTITIKKKGTLKRKLTGLKKKKTYYVQIRTYKTVYGKKYYSAWSRTCKVKA